MNSSGRCTKPWLLWPTKGINIGSSNWRLMGEDELPTTAMVFECFWCFLWVVDVAVLNLPVWKLLNTWNTSQKPSWSTVPSKKHIDHTVTSSKLRRWAPPASTNPLRGCGLWRQSPPVRSSRACHKWCRSCQSQTLLDPCPSPSERCWQTRFFHRVFRGVWRLGILIFSHEHILVDWLSQEVILPAYWENIKLISGKLLKLKAIYLVYNWKL